MSFDHDEIVAEFLVEAFEGLDRLDQELIELEQSPDDKELINSIFRTVHTIKGTCGFLELTKLERIAHVGENLLDSLRAGRAEITEAVASALLELNDAIRTIMNTIEETGAEGDNEYGALTEKLKILNETAGKLETASGPEAQKVEQASPENGAEEESESPEEDQSKDENTQTASAKDEEERSEQQEDHTNHELLAEIMASEELSEGEATAEAKEEVEEPKSEPDLTTEVQDEDHTNHELLAEIMSSDELSGEEDNQESAELAPEEDDHTNYELLAELMGSDELPEAKDQADSAAEEPPAQEEDHTNHELLAELMASEGDLVEESVQESSAKSTLQTEGSEPVQAQVSSDDVSELLSDLDKSLEKHRVVGASSEEEKNTDVTVEAILNEERERETKPETVESEPSNVASDVEPQIAEVPKDEKEGVKMSASKEPITEEKESASNKQPAKSSGKSSGGGLADSSIRVDVSLLDQVMNLVGELVLARNQILQFTKTQTDNSFVNTCQRLNLITSELQEGVMKTRMQPIANVWNKFPRVVRDVARACGKEIKIEMEGKETELDKTILEAIKDPLTHIVRNSADHGIESPDKREEIGKPREGTLLLKAFHEGGHVIIQITDDGGGINPEKVKDIAIKKGVISEAQAARMSESELQKLIFAAGFSTAEQITNVSGRGVGMDVVRSNIEKIGGSVDVQSVVGEGTTLFIKIPLTLAIVPALIVSTKDQRFAIPQVSLLELVRLEGDSLKSDVESINGRQFYRLRGNLLPLVFLQQELQMNGLQQSEELNDSYNIVVVRAEEKEFGIVVDAVHDTEEIVVKPLGKQLKDIDVFAGATIMGDGRVALIMDVLGLGRRAHVVGDMQQSSGVGMKDEEVLENDDSRQTLLIVRVGNEYRMAIPLDQVDRLEEFETSRLETASGGKVVQYRGGILPLIDLQEVFEARSGQERDVLPVVVYSDNGKSVGLVVEGILDIVEESVSAHYSKGKHGISGSAVVQDKVTDLLDIAAVLQGAESGSESEARV